MDRRKFLKLVGASLIAVAVLPNDTDNFPKIYGDRVHDDQLGFQALMGGEVFEWMGEGAGPRWVNNTVHIPSGTYNMGFAKT